MANKEEFKGFVRNNPNLISYVNKGDMSWQKFYELFDLYGADNKVWEDYKKPVATVAKAATAATAFSLADTFNWLKNVNLDNVQSGINNLQRVVGVIGDLSNKNTTSTTTPTKEEYRPRPLYKHFED